MQDCFARLFDKGTPRIGDCDCLVIAIEEPEAELVFQLINLLAQGGLTDMQPVSSPRKIQLFRNCDGGL
jgi:hypothetical protein